MQDQAKNTADYIDLVRRINEDKQLRTGKQPLCHTHHYGCQQNVSDGEKINGMLAQMGFAFTESPKGADFVLYNTCAVRENAEDRIFGNTGALKHEKARNPQMVVALCGCMVQQKHIAEKIRRSFSYVDLLFGPSAISEFPRLLYQKLTEGGRIFEILDETGDIPEDLPVRRDGGVRAWIPIMYGCDNFCTYCVVPLVRGRERSRDPEKILEEARGLVAAGFRELHLLGQNVNSYSAGGVDFAGLLRKLNDIPGQFFIRFMSSHPKDCTRVLIDTIAGCEKVCNHLHLPVQSGSNRVLKAMNRRYTREDYLSLVEYAKSKIPGITFTSDILVGFPGETYEDFQETLELVKEVGYQSLFTFIYSKRVGTKAADMPDPIAHEEKTRWFKELLQVQNMIGAGQYRSLVGKTVTVLVDGAGKTGEGYLCGRNASNIIVEFQGPQELIGTFVEIEITGALNWAVLGVCK